MRNAGVPVRGPDRRVDVVVYARVPGQLRQPLSLFLFALDAGFPRVLDGEHAPRPSKRARQRRRIVEIARDDLDALRAQRAGRVSVGVPRHGAKPPAGAGEGVDERAPLLARGASDQNRAICV